MKTKDHKQKILVTGGAGFIGSHLVEKLIELGNQVSVLDDLSTGYVKNLPSGKKLRFVEGDIRNFSIVRRLVSQSDVVFHLAEYIPNTAQYGIGHVIKFSTEKPLLDFDVSVRGTLNILESAREKGTAVILASSAAVYGCSTVQNLKETTPTNPVTPYGASKLCAETYTNLYHKIYGLPSVIVRLFNVYGPKQRKYFMYDMLTKLRKNSHRVTLAGTGNEVRDFVYVEDVANSLIYLSALEQANGQTFNMGTGTGISIRETASLISQILELNPTLSFTGTSWKGNIERLVADNSKLLETGFSPKSNLHDGMRRLIQWYMRSS
jgi:UDP-glucose 4-epimerase